MERLKVYNPLGKVLKALITFFLYTPFLMTLPVGMYEAYASLRIEVGSAFTTLFLAFAITLTYIMNRLNKTKTK